MTPCLENLTPELQVELLYTLDDFQSLSALVHASPRIHAVYATMISKEDLWTQVKLPMILIHQHVLFKTAELTFELPGCFQPTPQ